MGGRTVAVHLLLVSLSILIDHGSSQQAYFNNNQYDCTVNHTNTLGYTCNGPLPSCTAYLTFRSTAIYSNVPSIAYLLSADATAIADANNVTDVAAFPVGQLIYVPVNCSCQTVSGGNKYYQHNASYRLKMALEDYTTIANTTYESLTTCQAMIAQNKYDTRNLLIGDELVAPLMCACPSVNQTKQGFKYVVSYLAAVNDDISMVAQLFGVDIQTILDANELDATSTIYPYNPILVPFNSTPTKIKSNPSAAPPATAPSGGSGSGETSSSSSSKKWLFAGIGIGAALVGLPVLFLFIFLVFRRQNRIQQQVVAPRTTTKKSSGNDESGVTGYSNYTGINSWSISSDGVRYAIESLALYKAEEVQRATENFSESRRIKGSVYRGQFNGDEVAVKVLNGDVSAEINILKQINHSNIIRLSGFCMDGGSTYLVYEMAEKGSLREQLRVLSWKQRVEVAVGVAEALNYLHNYCYPPYVHKNLSSDKVLLDANLRAKISNFSLARASNTAGVNGDLTMHVVGTKGYMPPEYLENGLVTPKMDVYAFGMILLELISGRPVDDSVSAQSITEVLREGGDVREKLSRFMDGSIRDECPFDQGYSMANLAKMCVSPDLNSRLSISEALLLLSKIHSSLHLDPSQTYSSVTQSR